MTAVEWLQAIELKRDLTLADWNKAKEIEKQQIIDAHGNKQKMNAGISTYKYTLTGEQYYNETYGK